MDTTMRVDDPLAGIDMHPSRAHVMPATLHETVQHRCIVLDHQAQLQQFDR